MIFIVVVVIVIVLVIVDLVINFDNHTTFEHISYKSLAYSGSSHVIRDIFDNFSHPSSKSTHWNFFVHVCMKGNINHSIMWSNVTISKSLGTLIITIPQCFTSTLLDYVVKCASYMRGQSFSLYLQVMTKEWEDVSYTLFWRGRSWVWNFLFILTYKYHLNIDYSPLFEVVSHCVSIATQGNG